ncbi:class I SAM-dependent methyltransferase [Mesorhizobium sp. B2-9-1]|nr:class I SAM-dependent methyltransferase [Mesorhizobium sp. B2-9-1]
MVMAVTQDGLNGFDEEFLAKWEPTSNREKCLARGVLYREQKGLEIGALNFPTLPVGDVSYVDYASTEELKKRHRDHPKRVQRMVDVTYVWPGSGSLAAIVGDTDVFDFAIACHVIEHVPNVLGWFRGIGEVLKPGGVFNLAIPDRRYTFDIRCPLSTMGELVEADLLGYVRPSIRQMFDHTYYAKAIEPGAIWNIDVDVDATPAFSGSPAPFLALQQAYEIRDNASYIDSHCWIFTPSSFLDLIDGACRLGLFTLVPDFLEPTSPGQFEFYFSAKKPPVEMPEEALRSLQAEKISSIRNSLRKRDKELRLLIS